MEPASRKPRQFGLKGIFFFTAGSAAIVWASSYHPLVTVLSYAAYLAAVFFVLHSEVGDEPRRPAAQS